MNESTQEDRGCIVYKHKQPARESGAVTVLRDTVLPARAAFVTIINCFKRD